MTPLDGARDFGMNRSDHITGEQHVGFPHADPRRQHGIRLWGESHMTEHRTPLLAEARHVVQAGAVTLQSRRHADDRPDRDHPGATNPRDHQVEARTERWHRGLGQRRVISADRDCAPRPRALHRDECRAEPL